MPAETNFLQERITALEELAAHQGRIIDELSGELARQWQLVDQMQKKFERLSERFSAMEEAGTEAPANVPPPHY